MIKETLQPVHFCDRCGAEAKYPYRCMGCGLELCYDCSKKEMVTYPHRVYSSGSGDGTFCKKCDAVPPAKVLDLWCLYHKIQQLRNESKVFIEDFEKRSKEVEVKVAELYVECKEEPCQSK